MPSILFAAILGLLGSAHAADKTPVLVSLMPQKFFVERVGGDRVAVTVLVGQGENEETFELRPQQAARLARTQVYFRIGVGFETAWLGKIRAASPAMKIVETQAGIQTLRLPEHDEDEHHHHESDADTHYWTSPLAVKKMVSTIARTLSEMSPESKSFFESNSQSFLKELDLLDAEIRASLKGVKSKSFLVFHPSWGYFADAYGLKQVPIERGGKEPGPKALAHVIDKAKREGIKVIFVQEQFSQREAQAVAKAIGARVVKVDPLAADYLSNMRKVAQAFAEGLKE